MPDLNEWVLDVPDKPSFEFGSIGTSDFPLSTQVDISDIDRDTQDQRHPTSDGLVMGKDTLAGFTLTFDLKILPQEAAPDLWTPTLDIFSPFVSAWRADSIRRTPGAYATLTNLSRNRLVYGRPRKCSSNLAKVRKGLLAYIATFDTNSPDWYSATENEVELPVVPPLVGKIHTPLESPVTTASQSAPTYDAVVNSGDVDAWPVIELYGPGSNVAISLENVAGTVRLWKINVPVALKTGQVLTIDTRPWSRSATLNGSPANGRIRGTQLEKCGIPPGTWRARFDAVDPSATALGKVRWRDAFASM